MYYPYVLKQEPDTFVVQFGGGLSTAVALKSGSEHVTVAEGNPAVLTAFREDKGLRAFTGDVLNNPKVTVIDYDGRLYVAHTKNRYDVIDLSLANSAGLSSPGGFSIVEKYSYTREAMSAYMRALKPGGILSVTLWNKEEPPKSVLKLYATMAAAARDVASQDGGPTSPRISTSSRPTSRPRPCSTSAAASRPRRSPSSTPTPRRCRSTRSTIPASRSTSRSWPQILQDYRDQFFSAGRGGRSDGAAEKEPNDKPPPGMTGPPPRRTAPRTRRTARRRRRACRPP